MKTLLTTIFSIIALFVVSVPSVSAISVFDLGGLYNPIHVQVQQDLGMQNTQKDNNLKSTYGLSNYYKCATGGSTQDLSNPNTMAQYLNTVQYCLERNLMRERNAQQVATAVASCPQGYVIKNRACVSEQVISQMYTDSLRRVEVSEAYNTPTKRNNQICKETYGLNSLWNGDTVTQGGLVCSCLAGFSFSTDGKSCVAVPVTPIKTNNQVSFGGGGSLEKAAVAVLPTSKKAPEIKKVQNKINEKTPDLINDEWKDPAYWNNKVATNAGEVRPKSPWEKVKGWFGF